MAMSISPENERLLNDVVASGRFKNPDEAMTEALRLLKDNGTEKNTSVQSQDEWRKKLEKHLSSIPKTTAKFLDDSRDTIYKGRGE